MVLGFPSGWLHSVLALFATFLLDRDGGMKVVLQYTLTRL